MGTRQMGSAKDQTPKLHPVKGPDLIISLRESLIEDPRIAQSVNRSDEQNDSIAEQQAAKGPPSQAAVILLTEHRVEHGPQKWVSPSNEPSCDSDSPSITPSTDSSETTVNRAEEPDTGGLNGQSVTKRLLRLTARGLTILATAAALLMLMSFEQDFRGSFGKVRDQSLGWARRISAAISATSINISFGKAEQPKPAPAPTPANQTVSNAPTALPSPALMVVPSVTQLQLESLTSDLADATKSLTLARAIIDQLTTNQEQMMRDIAALQTNEQFLNQKMNSLLNRPRTHKKN